MRNPNDRLRVDGCVRRDTCLLTAALGAAVLLAGCSSAVTSPSGTATASPGVVTGTLAWSGGPLPPPPAPGPTPTPVGGTITLRELSGTTFTTVASGDGEFSIQVPAGSYAVTGTSGPSGPAECQAGGTVTVVSGRVATVQVICPVP